MNEDALILLAEDDPNDEDLIRLALSQSNLAYTLDVVHDGVEVIDYLFARGSYRSREADHRPRVILLDLKMPRMNGLQVLQVLRRVRLNDGQRMPPVVALTSSNEDQDVNDAYRWGAHSYIRKPVDYEQFSRAVRAVVSYWLDLNEPPRGRAEMAMSTG
jgi:CheY-like chemotaxis protein